MWNVLCICHSDFSLILVLIRVNWTLRIAHCFYDGKRISVAFSARLICEKSDWVLGMIGIWCIQMDANGKYGCYWTGNLWALIYNEALPSESPASFIQFLYYISLTIQFLWIEIRLETESFNFVTGQKHMGSMCQNTQISSTV